MMRVHDREDTRLGLERRIPVLRVNDRGDARLGLD